MNKQQLASKIWESANKMRSKIEAHEYKDYILGFIFYKYLSDNQLRVLAKDDFSQADIKALDEADTDTTNYVRERLGYFIAYKDLFSTWIAMGKDFDGACVTDALSAFSRLIHPTHKKVFEGVFDTLQTGLSKLGESAASRTKAISDLIHLIKDIPMTGKQDYDVLGFVYEYLIGMFAANAGKKAGEFYTPHEVSLLMSEIVADYLKHRKEIKIYDPTSGSGSLLINIGRCVAKHVDDDNNIKYYAQELKQNTYNLTRMNLIMRGTLPDNIVTRNGDTLEDDWPYFDESNPVETYDPLYVDAVVSNPPYSQAWDPANKETDPRYAGFGLAPKSKADYAFLLHDLYHLKPDGVMTIVLPHGVLFRGGEEGAIRRNLLEQNHVDAIIGLPANIFFGTGIPTIIMVLRKNRPHRDVLIVDASKGFAKVGKTNKLRASDIKKIVDAVTGRLDVDKFSRRVPLDEIRLNDYNLNIPRYVDSSEAAESWDIYASMFGGIPTAEVDALDAYWQALPGLKETLLTDSAAPYTTLAVADVAQAVAAHPAVQAYTARFADAFAGFNAFLKAQLIDGMADISISKGEAVLGEDIFARLASVPLVNQYDAYQILDDAWSKTAVDLEMIQTEGFEAVKKVDPNMVVKKKNGRDEEVQDGWVGHVIPFNLAQHALLTEEAAALAAKEARLAGIAAEYEEVLDSLSEEEKEEGVLNDAGDGFAPKKELRAYLAALPRGEVYAEDSLPAKIAQVNSLLDEEKTLRAQVKLDAAALHMQTKAAIEALTDAQAKALLEAKWITPLVDGMAELPNAVVRTLAEKVAALAAKYEVTYAAIEAEIGQTEKELAAMMDELTGSEFDMKGLAEFQALLRGEA